jgi:hypothetical protein
MSLFTFEIHVHSNLSEEKLMAILDDLQASSSALAEAGAGLTGQLQLVTDAILAEGIQGAKVLADLEVLKQQVEALPIGNPALEQAAINAISTMSASAANLRNIGAGLSAVVASVQGIIPDAPAVVVPAPPAV